MRRFSGTCLVVLGLALLLPAAGCKMFGRKGPAGGHAKSRPPATRTTPPPPPASAPAGAPRPTGSESQGGDLLFHEGFESGKPGSGWTGVAVRRKGEDSDSIRVVTDPVRKGKYALQITVRAGDAVTDGDARMDKERCELLRLNSCRGGSCSLGDEGREGTEMWYAWSVLIPEGYQYVSTTKANYQIMGQWHDQPDPGQKPTGYSPAISVHYRASGGSQGFQIKYGRIQRKDPIQVFDAPIQKGKWVDLMFHVRFSQGNDGFLEAWKDGVPLTTSSGSTRITGPNMYNTEPNYLRLGLYRGKGQTQTNTFYYDEIRIATGKAALMRE